MTTTLDDDYMLKLRNDFSAIYDNFYNNGYSSELVKIGDRLLKVGHPAATFLTIARRDILTSDREVAAFAQLCTDRQWI